MKLGQDSKKFYLPHPYGKTAPLGQLTHGQEILDMYARGEIAGAPPSSVLCNEQVLLDKVPGYREHCKFLESMKEGVVVHFAESTTVKGTKKTKANFDPVKLQEHNDLPLIKNGA